MWFGDLVTMRWWDDLWLNESFAEYLGHRVCDRVTEHSSWVDFGMRRKAWGYAADRRPSTHPVAGNGAADAAGALNDFDGISYAKGAAVLRQLATHVGDEVFFDGLRRHFDAHAYANAEFSDLIGAWTAAGALDLPEWADAWLRTSGLDTLRAATVGNNVRIHRDPPPGATSNRPHAITVADYDVVGAELRRVPVALHRPANPVPGRAGKRSAALVLPNAGDETWAKIALDAGTWQAMPRLLPGIADPLARTVIWNALRLAVADAELDPALALDVPVAAIADEPNDTVIASVLSWTVGSLIGAYHPVRGTTGGYRTHRRGRIAGGRQRRAGLGTATRRGTRPGRLLVRRRPDARLGQRRGVARRHSSWTPTCAGDYCTGSPFSVRFRPPRSTPRRRGTTPRRARCTRRDAGRRCPSRWPSCARGRS